MMGTVEFLSFASAEWWVMLGVLGFARGMDFLSTWVATPNLVLEANPLARMLGWKAGILVNLVLSGILALWPLPAIMIATTSLLVAARNFQGAWLMRSLGEFRYRSWMNRRICESRLGVYLFCFLMQVMLVALIGLALIEYSGQLLVPFAVGWGILAYSITVAFYTLLSVWRARRNFNTIPADGHYHVFTDPS